MRKTAILCVDDELIVTNALHDFWIHHLQKDQIIEVAQSAEEALEVIDELQEDGIDLQVIIVDYLMPHVRGDELLIEVYKKSPHTKSIMLTGQSSIDGIKRAINEADLYRFIEKPWHNEDLLLTMNSAISAYENERELERQNTALKQMNDELESKVTERTKELLEKNTELETAIAEVKTLSGILPICSSCKKIRDDKGYWRQVEAYIEHHSEAQFTHSICDPCSDKLYGDQPWYKKVKAKRISDT